MGANLYVHFPFCRRKCTYCALHSRAGTTPRQRADYVQRLVSDLAALDLPRQSLSTIYFGGGSPALCDLSPLMAALGPFLAPDAEFTVELHPLDISDDLLEVLKRGGVNRISMGVQSFDDSVLAAMGRCYDIATAAAAFRLVKRHFDNAGIDLIIGYPADNSDYSRLSDWGLVHCSVYSLILEPDSILGKRNPVLPSDDEVLDRLAAVASQLRGCGLERYEISNYARAGAECRHNLAVWRGEDYYGLGEGAAGRVGLTRTLNGEVVERVEPSADLRERTIFRLRTREGLDSSHHPEWLPTLRKFAAEGLLVASSDSDFVFRLTPRGTEVCDSLLAEL